MTEKKGPSENAVQGEGDYKAARAYRLDIDNFMQKKQSQIPKLAKAAARAVEGAEGPDLAEAERKGKSKARR